MRAMLVLSMVLLAVGCGGEKPCCSVQDVVRMKAEGIDDSTILLAVRSGQAPGSLTASDIVALKKAGASDEVVVALGGQTAEAAAAEPAAAPTPEATDAAAEGAEAAVADASEARTKEPPAEPTATPVPRLDLACDYKPGAKSFVVRNLSGRRYTGVVLTANGSYVYRLPVAIDPGKGDRIRLGSFVNRDGLKLDSGIGIERLSIRANQGSWYKRY